MTNENESVDNEIKLVRQSEAISDDALAMWSQHKYTQTLNESLYDTEILCTEGKITFLTSLHFILIVTQYWSQFTRSYVSCTYLLFLLFFKVNRLLKIKKLHAATLPAGSFSLSLGINNSLSPASWNIYESCLFCQPWVNRRSISVTGSFQAIDPLPGGHIIIVKAGWKPSVRVFKKEIYIYIII